MKLILKALKAIKGGKNTLGVDAIGRPHWRTGQAKACKHEYTFHHQSKHFPRAGGPGTVKSTYVCSHCNKRKEMSAAQQRAAGALQRGAARARREYERDPDDMGPAAKTTAAERARQERQAVDWRNK